ncbi:trypsin-like peptidase domain-containing protein [Amycolatopsis sp. NPDC051128]|uniref:trypsin-like serine peptidase n=1 Tax=Amycolatopsis sp. NPDC051128 TaxID=3155412 RepID=UPI0034495E0B
MTTSVMTHRLLTGAAPSTHRVGMPFEPDNRERVGQTIQAPWSATGLVSATFPTGFIAEATGFVIGDRFVVTAAHAVYDKEHGGGVASQITFEPARNATQLPYGPSLVSTWKFPTEYPSGGRLYDYCLLKLAKPLPSEVVHYQLTVASDEELTRGEFQIAGYPDDKAPENSMWSGSGKLLNAGPRILRYKISTSGGQSGAAVATYLGVNQTKAVGIHVGVAPAKDANEAVRLTKNVVDQINSWK